MRDRPLPRSTFRVVEGPRLADVEGKRRPMMASQRQAVVLASCAFAAGAVGGFANFLMPILLGYMHVMTSVGVEIEPDFSKFDLYHKVFWGGLWGFTLLLRLPKRINNRWIRATLYGIPPSLVQLFVVFPLATNLGVAGLRLGALTPAFVLLFNSVGWSWPAYWWFVMADEEGSLAREGYASVP